MATSASRSYSSLPWHMQGICCSFCISITVMRLVGMHPQDATTSIPARLKLPRETWQ